MGRGLHPETLTIQIVSKGLGILLPPEEALRKISGALSKDSWHAQEPCITGVWMGQKASATNSYHM